LWGDSISTKKEQLKKEGWERQFTYDEPRLSEAKELYESLGYEVRLEPATKEEIEGDCSVCLEEDMDKYKTIYTRKIG
jgi:hypothetical protein